MKHETTLALFTERPSSSLVGSPKTNRAPQLSRRGPIPRDSGAPPRHPTRPADRSAGDHWGRRSGVASEDRLLTVDEFADSLRVTRACVRKWILERKVGVVKIGRLVRLRFSELRRIVDQGSRPAVQRG